LEILSVNALSPSWESGALINELHILLISVSTSSGLPANIARCKLSQFAACISSFLQLAATMMRSTGIRDR
ncbi:MAG: hypothetical protein JSS70_17585, partial [Bacteroidetes bacterium]|nr:hypothetical protein [Bacteroidota bacterium]